MGDLEKEKRTLNDLSGISLSELAVGVQKKRKSRTKEHNKAISKAKKDFYASEKGIAERKVRSERTKAYWDSTEGQAKKERLREKYKGKSFRTGND
jgi:hypothetical protein